MKRVLLVLFTLNFSIAFCQKKEIQIAGNEIIVGKNLIDNSDIKGTEYTFPNRIDEVHLDSVTGFLTAHLRDINSQGAPKPRGRILQYDFTQNKVLWSKKIAYEKDAFWHFGNFMISQNEYSSSRIDPHSGNELWTTTNSIYVVDTATNIGIGYKSENFSKYSTILVGIDMQSGNLVWAKKVDGRYRWDNLFYLNDSTIIVVASGLHSINIKNGNWWTYRTDTWDKDYSRMIATNVLGLVSGLLTGFYMVSTEADVTRGLLSNVLADSAHLYFASKEQLAKLDQQSGDILWQYPFPKDVTSTSSIFLKDSLIFMINTGLAYHGNEVKCYGQPFIAAFDKSTGKQKYISLFKAGDNPIVDFKLTNDEAYLCFANRIAKYSIKTGELIKEEFITRKGHGNISYFVGERVFIRNQKGDFVNLLSSDTTKMYILTMKDIALAVDNQLNVLYTPIDYEDMRICYLQEKGYKFIETGSVYSVIVNNEGKDVAKIAASSNAFIKNNILYDIKGNRLIAIDLEGEIMK